MNVVQPRESPTLTLGGEAKFTHCRHCHRPLKRPEYRERGSGETCGGRIKRSRKPVRVEYQPGGSEVEVLPGQLPLFELAGAA